MSPFESATIFAAMRQPEKALDWLDRAIYERSQPINFLQLNPTFAGLRRSRHFVRCSSDSIAISEHVSIPVAHA